MGSVAGYTPLYSTIFLDYDHLKRAADANNMSDKQFIEKMMRAWDPLGDEEAFKGTVCAGVADHLAGKIFSGLTGSVGTVVLAVCSVATMSKAISDKALSDDLGELVDQMDAYGRRGAMKLKLKLGYVGRDDYFGGHRDTCKNRP